MIPYLQEKSNFNYTRFLIRNQGDQKEVAHFSSAERKGLSTQNPVKIAFENEGKNQDILR